MPKCNGAWTVRNAVVEFSFVGFEVLQLTKPEVSKQACNEYCRLVGPAEGNGIKMQAIAIYVQFMRVSLRLATWLLTGATAFATDAPKYLLFNIPPGRDRSYTDQAIQ